MNPYFSLILPCFNEGEHLKKSFIKLIKVLKTLPYSFEIIFVEDKSTDRTLSLIREIISQNPDIDCKLITHQKNQGRGKSVVDGVRAACGTIVGFIDVDLEVDPKYINQAILGLKSADVIVGRRQYEFYWTLIHRFFATKIYASLVKALLNLPVNDTEAGFKFFRRKKILPLLKVANNPGWFWDTEIVVYSNLAGLRLVELPVVYKRRQNKTSTVKTLPDSIVYLFHLISLCFRLRQKKLKCYNSKVHESASRDRVKKSDIFFFIHSLFKYF